MSYSKICATKTVDRLLCGNTDRVRVSSQLLAPHVSVEEPEERDNLGFLERLDDELEDDCSRENTAIRALRSSHC